MCVLALVAVVLILARMAHTSIHAHGEGWGNAYVRLSEAGAEGKRALYITPLHFLENEAPHIVTLCPRVGLAFGAPQVGEF